MPPTVKCTVTTNRPYEDNCVIDEEKSIMYITDVFSESTSFNTEVIILMEGVINPENNKE